MFRCSLFKNRGACSLGRRDSAREQRAATIVLGRRSLELSSILSSAAKSHAKPRLMGVLIQGPGNNVPREFGLLLTQVQALRDE